MGPELSDVELELAVAEAILTDRSNPRAPLQPFQPAGLLFRLGVTSRVQIGLERWGHLAQIAASDLTFRVEEYCWRLVVLGLVVPQRGGDSFRATQRGAVFLASQDSTAITPGSLDARLSDLGYSSADPVRQYSTLGQDCLRAGHFEASVVMLGAASEAVLDGLAKRMASNAPFLMPAMRPRRRRETARETLDWLTEAVTAHYNVIAQGLNTRGKDSGWLDPLRTLLGTGQAIRLTRNEAGHPTGIVIQQHEALQLFVLFPRFVDVSTQAINALN